MYRPSSFAFEHQSPSSNSSSTAAAARSAAAATQHFHSPEASPAPQCSSAQNGSLAGQLQETHRRHTTRGGGGGMVAAGGGHFSTVAAPNGYHHKSAAVTSADGKSSRSRQERRLKEIRDTLQPFHASVVAGGGANGATGGGLFCDTLSSEGSSSGTNSSDVSDYESSMLNQLSALGYPKESAWYALKLTQFRSVVCAAELLNRLQANSAAGVFHDGGYHHQLSDGLHDVESGSSRSESPLTRLSSPSTVASASAIWSHLPPQHRLSSAASTSSSTYTNHRSMLYLPTTAASMSPTPTFQASSNWSLHLSSAANGTAAAPSPPSSNPFRQQPNQRTADYAGTDFSLLPSPHAFQGPAHSTRVAKPVAQSAIAPTVISIGPSTSTTRSSPRSSATTKQAPTRILTAHFEPNQQPEMVKIEMNLPERNCRLESRNTDGDIVSVQVRGGEGASDDVRLPPAATGVQRVFVGGYPGVELTDGGGRRVVAVNGGAGSHKQQQYIEQLCQRADGLLLSNQATSVIVGNRNSSAGAADTKRCSSEGQTRWFADAPSQQDQEARRTQSPKVTSSMSSCRVSVSSGRPSEGRGSRPSEHRNAEGKAPRRVVSPLPPSVFCSRNMTTRVQPCASKAFRFFMEQHVENVIKQHRERVGRRMQLEKEMSVAMLGDRETEMMRQFLSQKESHHLRLKRQKLNRSMFDRITTLGVGAFGEVNLVRKKPSASEEEGGGGALYAMKTLRKTDVIKLHQAAHVKAERDILSEADSQWIVKLYYSFQDADCLHFVMEYIAGGDMMALLIRKEIFDEPLARYVMKTLRKTDVIALHQAAHVKAERDILSEADSQWIVKLYYSFQDADYLHFVMEYIAGGDMMALLIRKEIFDEPLARYVMKTLRKTDVIALRQAAHIKAERDILSEADSQWIVKLYYSFQDADCLHFVMEYIAGGDMMALLIRKEIFDEPLARYVMKTLRKTDVIALHQAAHVKAERDILSEADSQWIVKLYYLFQDADCLHFVMEYIAGGDMMALLIRKEIFDEPLARYVMKTLRKTDVIALRQAAHIKAERDILSEADSQWIVKLYYSFQDADCLHFVMEYIAGGDMMALLIRKEIFDEPLARYVMKTLRKMDVIALHQAAHVKAERDILSEADSQWIVKLYYLFQDADCLHFVMEYIAGGDMMALLIRKEIFDEPLARYAMKTLRKTDVIALHQAAHIKAERDILSEADSQWIVKLYYSFQDADCLHFVMEYIAGGDMMALLIRKEIFDEPLARYAMKTLRKTDVIALHQAAHIKAERDILSEADNQWIVKFYYSFQDADCLHFVMEYIAGGDMMALLIRKEIFDEPLARYAMKTLRKTDVIALHQAAHIKAERDILSEADSQWIVKFYYSFQDADCLHFVMEYIAGGDMMALLIRKEIFDEPLARYAMKTLRKTDVIALHQAAHIKAERDILFEADSQWIVKLYYSFQDADCLHFVMEYIAGGDMMALLIRKEIFDEAHARFYIAELICAIEYVHGLGFIHRDIKPDNILIDASGHIKLTDFGLCTGLRWTHDKKYYEPTATPAHHNQDSMDLPTTTAETVSETSPSTSTTPRAAAAKVLHRRRANRRAKTHSLVGTTNYMAPEVLSREGHTQLADWWSAGVILYEMLVGRPPFHADSPRETQAMVIRYKDYLKFPSVLPYGGTLSSCARDLIQRLCCDQSARLGATNGAAEIKQHSFFEAVNFATIRQTPAPYVPPIAFPTDTSNFEAVDDGAAGGAGQKTLTPSNDNTIRDGDTLTSTSSTPTSNGVGGPGGGGNPAFYEFTFRHFFQLDGHGCPSWRGGAPLLLPTTTISTSPPRRPPLAPVFERPSPNVGGDDQQQPPAAASTRV